MKRALTACWLLAGCAAPWLDDPGPALPEQLSAVGLYPDPAHRSLVHPRAIAYEPSLALWSNGSDKERFLVLPDGASVDTHDPDAWVFPVGTTFFKTFVFDGTPVETRVLHRREAGWEVAVYAWHGSDAELLDGDAPTIVAGGDHEIPSARQCRMCHESNDTFVIGFDDLRLADRLGELHTRGVFDRPPSAAPAPIEAETPLEMEVLGYLHGNCAHCHNGRAGPSNSFSLEHPHARANLVERPTESSGVEPGLRVAPGNPDRSVVYSALLRDSERPMPPVGVQRPDEAAIARVRAWIEDLH